MNMKLDPEKWYSITDLVALAKDGYVPFLSRTTWTDLVQSKKLPYLIKGDENKKVYMLQGKDIISYLDESKIPENKE